MPCKERVTQTYFAPANERVDLVRPGINTPLGLNALGDTLSGSGFANPVHHWRRRDPDAGHHTRRLRLV